MKVEKVMINGEGYYRFRECENIQDRCAQCCFSKGCRCDLPFTCEAKSYYVRPEDCPVEIANATINVDLPTPPEVGETPKAKEGEVAAKQRLTERSENEADEKPISAGDSGVNIIVPPAEGIHSYIVPNGQHAEFKADKVKREGGIGKRSYYAFPNGVEAEDICRYLSFNLGNVVKYSCRAGRKDAKKKIEDLQKARDYLDNEIKRLEEGEE